MSVFYTRAVVRRLPARDGDPADGAAGYGAEAALRPRCLGRDPATPPALTPPVPVPLRQPGTTAELTLTAEA